MKHNLLLNTQEPPQGYRSLKESENPKVGDLIFIRANEVNVLATKAKTDRWLKLVDAGNSHSKQLNCFARKNTV